MSNECSTLLSQQHELLGTLLLVVNALGVLVVVLTRPRKNGNGA